MLLRYQLSQLDIQIRHVPIRISVSYFVDFNKLILAYTEKQKNQTSQQNNESKQRNDTT